MTNETMDAAKAEAFAGPMIGYINDALIALLISVGHRAALFDKMSVRASADVMWSALKAGQSETKIARRKDAR